MVPRCFRFVALLVLLIVLLVLVVALPHLVGKADGVVLQLPHGPAAQEPSPW